MDDSSNHSHKQWNRHVLVARSCVLNRIMTESARFSPPKSQPTPWAPRKACPMAAPNGEDFLFSRRFVRSLLPLAIRSSCGQKAGITPNGSISSPCSIARHPVEPTKEPGRRVVGCCCVPGRAYEAHAAWIAPATFELLVLFPWPLRSLESCLPRLCGPTRRLPTKEPSTLPT